MASEKQLSANRANAKHSTGPQTATGKALSRMNAWDRRTLSSTCVHSEISGRSHFAAYVAKVRVSVRAGKITIVREGSGMGEAVAPTLGQAHELVPQMRRDRCH
jgi:hypothetical protein